MQTSTLLIYLAGEKRKKNIQRFTTALSIMCSMFENTVLCMSCAMYALLELLFSSVYRCSICDWVACLKAQVLELNNRQYWEALIELVAHLCLIHMMRWSKNKRFRTFSYDRIKTRKWWMTEQALKCSEGPRRIWDRNRNFVKRKWALLRRS